MNKGWLFLAVVLSLSALAWCAMLSRRAIYVPTPEAPTHIMAAKLSKDMSADEVRQRLGKPDMVSHVSGFAAQMVGQTFPGESTEYWFYKRPEGYLVCTFRADKLDEYKMP